MRQSRNVPHIGYIGIVNSKRTKREIETGRNLGMILVVDDDVFILRLTKRMLSLLGFTALLAQNGTEALDIYREQKDDIACVIVDLSMPGMSGKKVARSIWQISPTTKIIFCSGHDEQRAIRGISDSGPLSFLKKPLTLTDLKTALQKVFVDKSGQENRILDKVILMSDTRV